MLKLRNYKNFLFLDWWFKSNTLPQYTSFVLFFERVVSNILKLFIKKNSPMLWKLVPECKIYFSRKEYTGSFLMFRSFWPNDNKCTQNWCLHSKFGVSLVKCLEHNYFLIIFFQCIFVKKYVQRTKMKKTVPWGIYRCNVCRSVVMGIWFHHRHCVQVKST